MVKDIRFSIVVYDKNPKVCGDIHNGECGGMFRDNRGCSCMLFKQRLHRDRDGNMKRCTECLFSEI